jgi:hypothetical protein
VFSLLLTYKNSLLKYLSLLFSAFTLAFPSFAQRDVQMKNLWTRPQVHVLFQGYTLSFTIKDINKAMELLRATGDSTFKSSCALDTAGDYVVELYPGLRQEYHSELQRLLQKGVGAFLLTSGHAYIETSRHKILHGITTDIHPLVPGVEITVVKFYDPRTNTMLFDGIMPANLYNQDLGID